MIVLRGCQACKTELETESDEYQVTKDNREEGSCRCQVSGFPLGHPLRGAARSEPVL
jgi:hypothetical protein